MLANLEGYIMVGNSKGIAYMYKWGLKKFYKNQLLLFKVRG
jgi:hypothetical protein